MIDKNRLKGAGPLAFFLCVVLAPVLVADAPARFEPGGDGRALPSQFAADGGFFNYIADPIRASSLTCDPTSGRVFVADSDAGRILVFDSNTRYFVRKWSSAGEHPDLRSLAAPFALTRDAATASLALLDGEGGHLEIYEPSGRWIETRSGAFEQATSLADAPGEDLMVFDAAGRAVKIFGPDGSLSTSWSGEDEDSQPFDASSLLASDLASGRVAVADGANDRIQIFDFSGSLILRRNLPGLGPEIALAIQPGSGRLAIADKLAGVVHILGAEGALEATLSASDLGLTGVLRAGSLLFLGDGTLVVGDVKGQRLLGISPQGVLLWLRENRLYDTPELDRPSGIAVSPKSGDLFVVDQRWNTIKRFSRNGEVVDIWGGLGSTAGRFDRPTGIVVDPEDRVLVAEERNHRIQILTSEGEPIAEIGRFGSNPGEFKSPTDVEVSPLDGSIYVADQLNHRIQKFDPKGNFVLEFGGFGREEGRLSQPFGVDVHPLTGEVWVADTANNRVQVFSSGGEFRFAFGELGYGPGRFAWPRYVAIDRHGGVYVASTDHNLVQKFDSEGQYLQTIRGIPEKDVLFHPRAVALDQQNGDLYVAASYEGAVHRFSDQGEYLSTWGYFAPNRVGELNRPGSIAYSPLTREILVADIENDRVSVFDRAGHHLRDIGRSCQHFEEDGLCEPASIALDPRGRIFVGAGAHEDPQNVYTPLRYLKVFDANGTPAGRWGGWQNSRWVTGVSFDPVQREVVLVVNGIPNPVKRFDEQGGLIAEFGSADQESALKDPRGLSLDPVSRTVFVSDGAFARVRAYSYEGEHLFDLEAHDDTGVTLGYAAGLEMGLDGRLYVADPARRQIVVFDPRLRTVDGALTEGLRGRPYDLVFDSMGNMYVAGNDARQKVSILRRVGGGRVFRLLSNSRARSSGALRESFGPVTAQPPTPDERFRRPDQVMERRSGGGCQRVDPGSSLRQLTRAGAVEDRRR